MNYKVAEAVNMKNLENGRKAADAKEIKSISCGPGQKVVCGRVANIWTDDEIKLLKKNYRKGFKRTELLECFPRHSMQSINQKIKTLGLSKEKPKTYWDKEETDKLLEIVAKYPNWNTNKEIKDIVITKLEIALPNKTYKSIIKKLYNMKFYSTAENTVADNLAQEINDTESTVIEEETAPEPIAVDTIDKEELAIGNASETEFDTNYSLGGEYAEIRNDAVPNNIVIRGAGGVVVEAPIDINLNTLVSLINAVKN